MFKTTNIFFIIAIVASRFLPHPPNFTPIIAIFIITSGVAMVPLLITYLFTDILIGLHPYMIWIYSSLLMIGLLKQGPVFSSVLFFLITNFGVWSSGFYGFNLQGLMLCYYMALPFFINSLISTVIFYYLIQWSKSLSIRSAHLSKTAQ